MYPPHKDVFTDLLCPWRKGGTVLDILRTACVEDIPPPVVDAYVHCLRRWMGSEAHVVVLDAAAALNLARPDPRIPPRGSDEWTRTREAWLAARAVAVPVCLRDRCVLNVLRPPSDGDGGGGDGVWAVSVTDPDGSDRPLPGVVPYLEALVGPCGVAPSATASPAPAPSVLRTLTELKRTCLGPSGGPEPVARGRLWAALSRIAAVAARHDPDALDAAIDAERDL
jgi:hypothetical protein